MSPNVSTVMFAIEGGMRLYAAGKQVYVDKKTEGVVIKAVGENGELIEC